MVGMYDDDDAHRATTWSKSVPLWGHLAHEIGQLSRFPQARTLLQIAEYVDSIDFRHKRGNELCGDFRKSPTQSALDQSRDIR